MDARRLEPRMARLNITGFETGNTAECSTSSGTFSMQGTTVRTGAYALRTNPTGSGTGYGEINGLATTGANAAFNVATLWIRFYFRYATKPAANSEPILRALNTASAPKLRIHLDSAGKLHVINSAGTDVFTGSTVLSANTWYRIEASIATGTSAAWELLIDGVSEGSGSTNTTTTNHGAVDFGKVPNVNGNTVDFFYDDIAIDAAGYPGAGQVEAMQPDGNGTYTAWTGTYTDVDEIPHDSDTTYISAMLSTGAETATLESTAAAGISGVVAVAKTCAIVRATTDAIATAFRVRTRSGSTDSDTTADYDASTSYVLLAKLYATDPNTGSAWTLSGLDGAEPGVVNNNNLTEHRCTQILIMVEFDPSAGGLTAGEMMAAAAPSLALPPKQPNTVLTY